LFPTFSLWADPPPNYNKGVQIGDPIMASSGKFYFDIPLLDLGGPLPLRYQLEYLMDNWNWFYLTGMFGPFWSNLNPYAYRYPTDDPDGDLYFLLRGGRTARFTWDAGAGEWALGPESPVRYRLQESGSAPDQGYYYILDPVNERLYFFQKTLHIQSGDPTARIIAQMDRNGNRLDFSYSDPTLPRPAKVEDGLGRSLDFSYITAGYSWPLLDTVTDQAGREISFDYNLSPGQCGYPVVESVTNAEGHTTTFQYACPGGDWPWARAIKALVRPLGNVPYSQTVEIRLLDGEEVPRVTSQSDVYGNMVTLTYAEDSNRVTETRADSEVVVYEHYHNHGVPKSLVDPSGKEVQFGQTANEQLNQITDRMGDSTTVNYHSETGKIASFTDAEGRTTTWTYQDQGQVFVNPMNEEEMTFTFYNLTRIDYPDGTYETFTHDGSGNMLTHTNRAGGCGNTPTTIEGRFFR
jgi:YD repeat-containing protein